VDDFLRATPVPNYRTTFGPEWLRDNMRTLTWCQDEPLIASTLFAQYRVFELAKERGAVVVLDGQGSDEVFGGYPWHELAVWRERLMQGRFGDFARESRILARRAGVSTPRLAARELLRGAAGAFLRRLRLPTRRYPWIDEGWFRARRGEVPPEVADRRREIAAWPSGLERVLYSEMRYTSLPQLFLFSDHSGMAHSIEARLPFLDHRLVEFAVQLPPELKTGFGIRKRLLRRVARPYLPASIVDRPDKMGFVTPEAVWLRRELRDDLLALGRSRALASLPFLRMSRLREFVSGYLDGRHEDFRAVWRLYALRHWIETFEPSA
jgi:asparagine synthase (glutamine-hydrolysing)